MRLAMLACSVLLVLWTGLFAAGMGDTLLGSPPPILKALWIVSLMISGFLGWLIELCQEIRINGSDHRLSLPHCRQHVSLQT